MRQALVEHEFGNASCSRDLGLENVRLTWGRRAVLEASLLRRDYLVPSKLPTASILTGGHFGAVTLVTLRIVIGHRRLGHD
jgi:hypothetical protein